MLVLHGLPDKLRFLDSRGDELAHLREDFNDDRALFSPEDVAGLSAGISRCSMSFGMSSNVSAPWVATSKRSIWRRHSAKSRCTRRPLPPLPMVSSRSGTRANTPLIRLTDGGALLAEHMPRYDDGSPTGRLHDLRYDPDGGLWGSDGEALLRINDDGVVDAVVGHRPAEARLTEVGGQHATSSAVSTSSIGARLQSTSSTPTVRFPIGATQRPTTSTNSSTTPSFRSRATVPFIFRTAVETAISSTTRTVEGSRAARPDSTRSRKIGMRTREDRICGSQPWRTCF
ncbi:MAG: hypothetical protein BMS9Abin37_0269 [Acidobacteriota bacterium]|nr:MAG: hypothetical protein BMS9Abin37_0269 [Acidobacteriota bacterium]